MPFTMSTTRCRRLVAEHPDGEDLGRDALDDPPHGLGRDLARRRGEDEPDGVGPQGHGQQGVGLGGDPADLHEHGVTSRHPASCGATGAPRPRCPVSARTAARRSAARTSDSPTSTAW